jgi:glycosyltransferase involved in cell wall biosynthesis
VATDAPGLRDSVRRDETGLLVPFADDAAMAGALVRMLADEPLRERMGRAAVEHASRFRWDDCGRRSIDALLGAGALSGVMK